MAVKPRKGAGLVLECDLTGGSSTWTAIGNRVTVQAPGWDREAIDETDLDDDWATAIPGVPDAGDLSLQIQYDPTDTTVQALEDMAEDDVIYSWRFGFNHAEASNKRPFKAFITSFRPISVGRNDLQVADITLRVVGPANGTLA